MTQLSQFAWNEEVSRTWDFECQNPLSRAKWVESFTLIMVVTHFSEWVFRLVGRAEKLAFHPLAILSQLKELLDTGVLVNNGNDEKN